MDNNKYIQNWEDFDDDDIPNEFIPLSKCKKLKHNQTIYDINYKPVAKIINITNYKTNNSQKIQRSIIIHTTNQKINRFAMILDNEFDKYFVKSPINESKYIQHWDEDEIQPENNDFNINDELICIENFNDNFNYKGLTGIIHRVGTDDYGVKMPNGKIFRFTKKGKQDINKFFMKIKNLKSLLNENFEWEWDDEEYNNNFNPDKYINNWNPTKGIQNQICIKVKNKDINEFIEIIENQYGFKPETKNFKKYINEFKTHYITLWNDKIYSHTENNVGNIINYKTNESVNIKFKTNNFSDDVTIENTPQSIILEITKLINQNSSNEAICESMDLGNEFEWDDEEEFDNKSKELTYETFYIIMEVTFNNIDLLKNEETRIFIKNLIKQHPIWFSKFKKKYYFKNNESINFDDFEEDFEEELPISYTEEKIKKYFNKKESILIKVKNIEESRYVAKALKNMGYDIYNWNTIMNSNSMEYPNYTNSNPGDFIRTLTNEKGKELVLTYDDFKNINESINFDDFEEDFEEEDYSPIKKGDTFQVDVDRLEKDYSWTPFFKPNTDYVVSAIKEEGATNRLGEHKKLLSIIVHQGYYVPYEYCYKKYNESINFDDFEEDFEEDAPKTKIDDIRKCFISYKEDIQASEIALKLRTMGEEVYNYYDIMDNVGNYKWNKFVYNPNPSKKRWNRSIADYQHTKEITYSEFMKM